MLKESRRYFSSIIDNSRVKVFDVRGTWATPARTLHDVYEDTHIPGEIFLNWTKEFTDTDLPVNLAHVADFEKAADHSNHWV